MRRLWFTLFVQKLALPLQPLIWWLAQWLYGCLHANNGYAAALTGCLLQALLTTVVILHQVQFFATVEPYKRLCRRWVFVSFFLGHASYLYLTMLLFYVMAQHSPQELCLPPLSLEWHWTPVWPLVALALCDALCLWRLRRLELQEELQCLQGIREVTRIHDDVV
jgi:hypothetical protein